MFREYYLPRYATLWGRAKELADVKVMLHSCGSIYHLLPGLFEAGLDIVQPVQTTAADMEPGRLKREFGRDICLWGGGCNTQEVLARGSMQDVIDDVKRRVEILQPNGGFVFQQIHNIMADVAPEKIVAMLGECADINAHAVIAVYKRTTADTGDNRWSSPAPGDTRPRPWAATGAQPRPIRYSFKLRN